MVKLYSFPLKLQCCWNKHLIYQVRWIFKVLSISCRTDSYMTAEDTSSCFVSLELNVQMYSVIYQAWTTWTKADVLSWKIDPHLSVKSSHTLSCLACFVCLLTALSAVEYSPSHTADLKHWHSSCLLRCVRFHNTQQAFDNHQALML